MKRLHIAFHVSCCLAHATSKLLSSHHERLTWIQNQTSILYSATNHWWEDITSQNIHISHRAQLPSSCQHWISRGVEAALLPALPSGQRGSCGGQFHHLESSPDEARATWRHPGTKDSRSSQEKAGLAWHSLTRGTRSPKGAAQALL